jgi:hypothetical protein
MEQINAADKKVSNPDEQQIGIFYILPGIPGNHKKRAGNDNAENFSKAVK